MKRHKYINLRENIVANITFRLAVHGGKQLTSYRGVHTFVQFNGISILWSPRHAGCYPQCQVNYGSNSLFKYFKEHLYPRWCVYLSNEWDCVCEHKRLKVIIIYLFTCWRIISSWNSTRRSLSLFKCRTGVALLHLAWKQWTMCSALAPSPQRRTGCRTLWTSSMNPWRSAVISRTPAVVLGFDKTTLKSPCLGKISLALFQTMFSPKAKSTSTFL